MSSVQDVFATTTAAIVQAIEAGAGDWEMPWSRPGLGFPINPTTHKHYRGGNVMVLLGEMIERRYGSSEWATYKQWQSIGAQVGKGERGTSCVFWSVKTPTMTVADEKTGEDVTLTGETKFRARTFVVFNASQVNGYTPQGQSTDAPDPIDTAEQFFAGVGADVETVAKCGRSGCGCGGFEVGVPALEVVGELVVQYAASDL